MRRPEGEASSTFGRAPTAAREWPSIGRQNRVGALLACAENKAEAAEEANKLRARQFSSRIHFAHNWTLNFKLIWRLLSRRRKSSRRRHKQTLFAPPEAANLAAALIVAGGYLREGARQRLLAAPQVPANCLPTRTGLLCDWPPQPPVGRRHSSFWQRKHGGRVAFDGRQSRRLQICAHFRGPTERKAAACRARRLSARVAQQPVVVGQSKQTAGRGEN